jgi:hypothetical protein
MALTSYQRIEKPLDREQLLEHFLQLRLEEIGELFGYSYIEGLQLEWVSASSIRVKMGACDFVDGSRRLRVPSDITVSGLSLSASSWYYAYLYNDGGSPALEVVTAAPLLYFATAYYKTGDTSRRYLGSVRTDGSGNIYQFYHDARRGQMRYLTNVISSPFRCANAVTATLQTVVDCLAVIPVTSRTGLLQFQNSATNTYVCLGAGTGAGDDSVAPPLSALGIVLQGVGFASDMPLNASRQFSYAYASAPTGGGFYADVLGYYFDR